MRDCGDHKGEMCQLIGIIMGYDENLAIEFKSGFSIGAEALGLKGRRSYGGVFFSLQKSDEKGVFLLVV